MVKKGKKQSTLLIDALHLFVLFGFAVAQPIFDLLSRHPEFLVSWQSKPIHLIAIILVPSLLLPLFAAAIETGCAVFGKKIRAIVHGFFVLGLLFALLLQVFKQIPDLSGWMIISGVSVTSVIAVGVYFQFRIFRFFLSVLAPAIVIFPLLFLFKPSIHKIVFIDSNPKAAYMPVSSTHPVVVVVFDEFPVTSLLDQDLRIDATTFPNFAELAAVSYWFRNATTVAERTFAAVPAILTGLYPDKSRIPTATDFPNNLFTLLGGSYDMKVFEPDTMLCPKTLCKDEGNGLDFVQQIESMLLDLSLAYLHIVVPKDFVAALPPVNITMKGFMNTPDSYRYKNEEKRIKKTIEARITSSQVFDRARLFQDFVDAIEPSQQPALYFLHVMIPHIPWSYFPSGKRYSKTSWRLPGLDLKSDQWSQDTWLVTQGYQRHLLQVGFADKLLGDLVDKLKQIGLYDTSLIVVTTDHGVSFFPKLTRRMVYQKENMDILSVPLFIKTPYQKKGVISDRNVENIDILPTIADILDIPLKWKIDGASAIDATLPERNHKIIYNYRYDKFVFNKSAGFSRQALERKLALFGNRTGVDGLFRIGRNHELIGVRISELDIVDKEGIICFLDQETLFTDVDPDASFIPAQITGRLVPSRYTQDPVYLLVAINGVVSAVSRTFQDEGGETRFFFMAPEKAFRTGINHVEILEAAEEKGGFKLYRLPQRTDTTYTLNQNKIIRSSEGDTFQITENRFNSSIDSLEIEGESIVFYGWAANVKASKTPDAIVIFNNNAFFYSGPCNQDRPDVVDHFNNKALKRSGFHYTLPAKGVTDLADLNIRIFALYNDGVASELTDSKLNNKELP